MIFHFWPVAGLLLVAQMLKGRYQRERCGSDAGRGAEYLEEETC